MACGREKVRSAVCVCEYTSISMIMCSSDIVVQIVDARNPLLFRCEDLVCNEQLTNLKCLFFFSLFKGKICQ